MTTTYLDFCFPIDLTVIMGIHPCSFFQDGLIVQHTPLLYFKKPELSAHV